MSENRPDSGAQAHQAPRKPGGLLASTVVVSGMTLLSRVLGLVRDVVIARLLGASAGADAFFVAFKIPNLMRRLFAEGAFNQAFVPVLSEYRSRGQMAATRLLVDRVAGTLGGTLVLVTLLGVLAAPWLVWLFAPGFGDHPEKRALTVEMLPILITQRPCRAIVASAFAINARRKLPCRDRHHRHRRRPAAPRPAPDAPRP